MRRAAFAERGAGLDRLLAEFFAQAVDRPFSQCALMSWQIDQIRRIGLLGARKVTDAYAE